MDAHGVVLASEHELQKRKGKKKGEDRTGKPPTP
jgi:hypothetical protein